MVHPPRKHCFHHPCAREVPAVRTRGSFPMFPPRPRPVFFCREAVGSTVVLEREKGVSRTRCFLRLRLFFRKALLRGRRGLSPLHRTSERERASAASTTRILPRHFSDAMRGRSKRLRTKSSRADHTTNPRFFSHATAPRECRGLPLRLPAHRDDGPRRSERPSRPSPGPSRPCQPCQEGPSGI